MNSKSILTALATFALSFSLAAQTPTGGVKGTVVSRIDRSPIENANLILYSGAVELARAVSSTDGTFMVESLADGMYDMVINAPGYMETRVNVTVNDGYIKNMFRLSLSPSVSATEIDDASFSEFDMDDSGYNDAPTILFGQNDVFNNIAGYNFSSVRFRARGYSNESQDVYFAGVKMNDAITGYGPHSLWSGLNEATRTKTSVTGAEVADYGLGGYNGQTDIAGNASSVRKGWRGSVLTNSSLYRLRLMMTYSSGMLDNGWAYAFSVSTRLGGNDWIKGVYYRSFGYYGSVEKKFNDTHKLGFTFMAAPGERGAQNGSTQEVYDLMGDNMYNSNWGWQDGKVRNARVRKTHEPIAALKYDFTPSDKFKASATVLYRFGKNGYTALDWYDAQDPRPDYYRNLPSYFYMPDSDWKRDNYAKYMWAKEAWESDYAPTTHINWDRLYDVNRNNATSEGNRSKYIQEERRVDQRDFNLALNLKWRPEDWLTVTGGASAKINRTEYYKIVADLLGGDYYLNVNQFAERDYASDETKYQYDLDYYLSHGNKAQVLREGDKYGYDYYAHVCNLGAWANARYAAGSFSANLGGKVGHSSFWREGLVRNGLFPEDSKGDSEKSSFLTYAVKGSASYELGGKMRFYANAGYFNDAPLFNQAFISPRTRNTLVPDLTTTKTATADLNWQYFSNGYSVRLTGFYTSIKDQTDVMSFYDDLQNAFTNFAMSGIDQRHMGIELGWKVPTPIENLSAQGVVSYGNYIYTSTPYMTQTVDNSQEIVRDHELVSYWKSHPDENGKTVQHYVPSTPQLAVSFGFAWNKNYWFVDADVEYFDRAYLDMNPLYRTDFATAGPDNHVSAQEIAYMAGQEKFDPAFLVNASVGKSWYIQRKYQIGFSLSAKNLLNNTSVKTGGYEQTRLVDNTSSKERYYRFDPKYFYMSGMNYMLNIYFRF